MLMFLKNQKLSGIKKNISSSSCETVCRIALLTLSKLLIILLWRQEIFVYMQIILIYLIICYDLLWVTQIII
jgi:hypothetical protein